MEQAILITKVSQLRYITGRYQRIYFGQEFCERLIPSLEDLNKIWEFASRREIALSLVTPYVTDPGLERLKPLFGFLQDLEVSCEIIINDWGVLHLLQLRYPNLVPVLGRLLTKQKRCPRLVNLLKRKTETIFTCDPKKPEIKFVVVQKKLPLDLDPYYKGSNVSSVPVIHEFLKEQRIKRIELDNLGQGMILSLPQDKTSASVYTPYVYITTTFFCLSRGCQDKEKSFSKLGACSKECQRYIFKLRHKTMPKIIYLKGNTQFYKNPHLAIKRLQTLGVDRIVYQPEIPV